MNIITKQIRRVKPLQRLKTVPVLRRYSSLKKQTRILLLLLILLIELAILFFVLFFWSVNINLSMGGVFEPSPVFAGYYSGKVYLRKELGGAVVQAIDCEWDRCPASADNLQLEDGTYYVTMVVFNPSQYVVGQVETVWIVDTVPPMLEAVPVKSIQNTPNAEISITSEMGAEIAVDSVQVGIYADKPMVIPVILTKEGNNEFVIVAKDGAGNESSKTVTIVLDTTIALQVTEPGNGATVNSRFTLKATTEPGATVSALGVSVVADANGIATLVVSYNSSKFDVVATDVAGNSTTVSWSVVLRKVAPAPQPPATPTCTRFANVKQYLDSHGGVADIIVTAAAWDNANIVPNLTADEFKVRFQYSASWGDWFSGTILKMSAFNKMCLDNRVLTMNLDLASGN